MTADAIDPLRVELFPAAQRSLRIACVTETWPPEVNGVSLTVARMVEGLQQRNHDVQLIRPRQPRHDGVAGAGTSAGSDDEPGATRLAEEPRLHEVLMRGLPIPRYPNLRMGVPSKRALVKLWALNRPDVVHIATEGPLGWSALQAARHLKLPVASDFRTNFHAYSKHYGIGWLHKPIMAYLRKFHNATQVTLVPTEALRRDLESYGFRNVEVVSRGVDTALFHPARRSEALRAQWGVRPDDLVVHHVGRLAPEKNLTALVAAWDAIRAVQPRARLLLVGDGPARADLQARLPDAIFAGQRRGTDLAAHYASGDLFLFPSTTETFGNVTTEAMASGVPVVAYDYAAAGQLIRPGLNGQLAPLDDTAAFVRTALALAQDTEARRSQGLAARDTAAALDWTSIVARLEQSLRRIVHSPAPQEGLSALRAATN